jgi:hypothetical protein
LYFPVRHGQTAGKISVMSIRNQHTTRFPNTAIRIIIQFTLVPVISIVGITTGISRITDTTTDTDRNTFVTVIIINRSKNPGSTSITERFTAKRPFWPGHLISAGGLTYFLSTNRKDLAGNIQERIKLGFQPKIYIAVASSHTHTKFLL